MATTMEIVVSAQDNASGVIEGVGSTAERTGGQIESSWDSASSAARTGGEVSAGASRSAAGGLDRMGQATDEVDTKAMGFRDALTGVQDTMSGTAEIAKGNLFEGFFTLGAGIGDLASSATNLLVPALGRVGTAAVAGGKQVAVASASFVASTARMIASMTATVASTVAGWVVMGAQALANAARMAAAWLIAMGPVGIIIAAVTGLVALIVANWDTIRETTVKVFTEVWEWLQGAWDSIVDAVSSAIDFVADLFRNFHPLGIIIDNWGAITGWVSDQWDNITERIGGAVDNIKGLFSGMWDGLTEGARSAANAAIGVVNGAVGGLNTLVSGANAIPGVNIPSIPRIPRLHEGGIFRAPRPGGEGLALLRDRERVTTPESDGRGRGDGGPGSMTLKVERGAGGSVEQTLATLIAYLIRTGALRLRVRNGRVVVS